MPPLRNCDSLPTLPLSNKWVSRLETISSHILGGPMPEPTIGRSECRALEKERKIVSVSDAVERIRDRSSIVVYFLSWIEFPYPVLWAPLIPVMLQVSGFVGCSSPEYLLQAVRQRFQRHNSPSGLHLIAVSRDLLRVRQRADGENTFHAEEMYTPIIRRWIVPASTRKTSCRLPRLVTERARALTS